MEHDFNKSVGKRLYDARKAKGYSRAKVGELVGLHETTVKRYEDGDIKALDIERIKAFAKVLGTPAAELLGWMSNGDDNLELMLSYSQDISSGRIAAKEDMIRTFGSEHSANDLQKVNDKVAVLYYQAMERRAAIALNSLLSELDGRSALEVEQLTTMLKAYLCAAGPIRDIVNTALRPYQEDENV